MAENGEIPTFPPRAVVDRILDLGFLSGPWNRSDLVNRWGDSVANKLIQEAKDYGWLVSPFPNEFYIPPAQDLMVVCWLPQPQRQEFIISRTLAATGLRYWCLSAWARTREIELPEPTFVTDLAPAPLPTSPRGRKLEVPSFAEIRKRNATALRRLRRIPFLENLILVPEIPQMGRFAIPARVVLPRGISKKPLRDDWLVDEDPLREEFYPARERSRLARFTGREIKFALAPRIDDPAWIVALLLALGLPRIQEILPQVLEREKRRDAFYAANLEQRTQRAREGEFLQRVQNWSAFFGQPSPNDSWQRVLLEGVFPYLLVPWALWNELSGQARARRIENVLRVRR